MSSEDVTHADGPRSGDIVIPGFQIHSKIGQGGTASVYLARQESTQRAVALKVISCTQHHDREYVRRFLRETSIVAKLEHPSIVPVIDGGTLRQHHFIAMEYLPGGSLRERLARGERGQSLARVVGVAIASALDAMHGMGFVHRDVKPNNILFRSDGTPVLSDFGLARPIRVLRKLTAAGIAAGTPSYMSPEQIEGNKLDGRTDLYSLGIVFHEVLTGVVPFEGDTLWSLSKKHLNEAMPRLPARYSAYQPFLDRLTAKNPAHRFRSGAEVIEALERIEPVSEADLGIETASGGVVDAVARPLTALSEVDRPRSTRSYDTTIMRQIPRDTLPAARRLWWLGIAATVVALYLIIACLTSL